VGQRCGNDVGWHRDRKWETKASTQRRKDAEEEGEACFARTETGSLARRTRRIRGTASTSTEFRPPASAGAGAAGMTAGRLRRDDEGRKGEACFARTDEDKGGLEPAPAPHMGDVGRGKVVEVEDQRVEGGSSGGTQSFRRRP
jgi:hypothetical protein